MLKFAGPHCPNCTIEWPSKNKPGKRPQLLLNVGTQLPRFWIDDLKFFLDSEGENVC